MNQPHAPTAIVVYCTPHEPLQGAAWDELRARWSRASIAQAHPHTVFNMSTIPYARKTGENESKRVCGRFP